MEAAFVDIGKGRNAVLYAGEVNWDAAGLEGQARRIENALKSGEPCSSRSPRTRSATRAPADQPGLAAGPLPRLRARGLDDRHQPQAARHRARPPEDDPQESCPTTRASSCAPPPRAPARRSCARDVERLTAQWEDIQKKAQKAAARRPALLHGEPDMTVRVVRDIFNEDFTKLVVSGDDAWDDRRAVRRARRPDLRRAAVALDRRGGRLRHAPDRRAARQGAGPQGLAAQRRLAGHRPDRGDDRRRRQHRQVHRLRAATSRRPSPRTTSRPPRRSSASCGCATSAASSSSTSSTWSWRATATWSCGACSSAWAGTAPSTRSPRSPRSAWSR